ncbi:T9SS type A sorting domain-containing protein [Flavobacterium sp. N1994]|uniref:T9SS type A sorting domain-containing protein n=1 Tax=Flavobacterium sp. N1994 TaxID=2986827 RepID=UPI002221C7DE|nr:T9SS type A sorting domain-containing protein [Flavobacterium sp. N1994]
MKPNFYLISLTILVANALTAVAQNKILFDATKAEMCSNADWIIDADNHNIYFNSTTHIPYVSSGSTTGASNPQRIPTPAQSGITSTTPETYWDGGISAFAVDCAKQGYIVESLPYNGTISYGTASTQDLSNYKVFVVTEPNTLFTVSEKIAIMNFIANGGGLMMICDHAGSDRNFDGNDPPTVWNDFLSNNGVANDGLGILFDITSDVSGNSTSFAPLTVTSPYYSILHGTFGVPSQVKWTSGATMTVNTTNNTSVKGLVFKSGSSTTGTTNVYVAASTYQAGKVFAVGDSSIIDDGTGDTGDTLYTGYTVDASGNHQKLLMNGLIWLITTTLSASDFTIDSNHFTIAPNPTQDKQIHFTFSLDEVQNTTVSLIDTLGRIVKEVSFNDQLTTGINYQTIDASDLQAGIYSCKFSTPTTSKSVKVVLQ